jgi:PAS domain S-box-containing protein
MRSMRASGKEVFSINNFEAFKNLIPSGVFTVDNDLKVTSWNRQAEIITGYSEKEILGKSCLTFAIEPCKEACGLKDNHVIKPILNRECKILTKDQRIVPILKNVDVLNDEKGNVIGGIESFISIEERVRFENKYKEQNAFLESIYKGSDSCLFVIDVDENKDFRFAGLNPAHEKLTGMRTEEIYGKTPLELDPIIPLEAGKHINQHYQDCYNAGKTIEYEEVIPIKGKDWHWLTKLTPLKNSDGEIYRIIGSATSINQLKEAHQELEIYKNNLEDLVKEKTEELKQQLEGNERVTEDLRVSTVELQQQIQERSALEEELRTNNDELLLEIEKRNETEKKLRQSEFEIGERLKETQCLHDIDVAATEEETAEGLFSKVIEIIPPGFMKPNVTGVQIKYDNLKFESKNYRTDAELLKENIIVHGKNRGQILVSYGEKTKKNPFLKEEAELLKSIRKRVCVSLEKRIENRRREHILNNAFDGFRINDIDGNIIEANAEYCKMLGYSKKELLGMTVQEIDSGRDGVDVNQLMHKVIKEKFLKYTDRQRRKDGKFIEVMNNASYFEEDELFYVFIEDLSKINKLNQELQQQITEKTAIEEELRASNEELEQEIIERRKIEQNLQQTNKNLKLSEEKYQRLMKNAKDMIYRMSLPEGVYEYVSPATNELLGYSPEEWYENPKLIEKIIHPDWHGFFADAWEDLTKGNVPETYEYQVIHKNGEVKWMNQKNVAIKDSKGKLIAIEGIVRDNTIEKEHLITIEKNKAVLSVLNNKLELEIGEKTAIEEELRASNEGLQDEIAKRKEKTRELEFQHEQFLAIYKNLPEIIYLVDPETYEVVFVNQHFEDLLGYNPVGRKCYEAFQGFKEPCDFCTNNIILNNNGEPYEWDYYNKNLGKHYYIKDMIIKWPDGRDLRFEIAVDITERKRAEEGVIKAERRFRALIENAPDGMVILDEKGAFKYASPNSSKMFDYKEEDLIGHVGSEFTHPDDLEEVLKVLEEITLNPSVKMKHVYRFRSGNGEYKWIETTFTNLLDDPVINGFVLNFSDITDKKLVAEKIKEREYLYKITTEATNLGIWDWKVDSNEVFYSDVWKAQLGYKPDEIKNEFTSWSALLHPEESDRCHKAVQDYLANPEGTFLLTFRMKHKDGSYRWINNHAHSFKDEKGHVTRMYGVHTDITEQKLSEQKLIDSEQRFRDIFEHSPLGKSITTLDGKLQTNKGFTDILGYSYEELQDIPFADITHPEDLEKSNRFVKDLIEGKMEFANFEKRYLHKHGHYVWTDVNVTLHKNTFGRPLFFITSISDISERKLADQKLHEAMKNLERSNKELEDFAYIASHDLQEPLRVIGSYVSLLSRRYKENLDKDAFEFIDFVEKGVSRMQNMIDDILDYSRVTTQGKEFLKYNPIESVNVALQNLRYKIEKSNASINVEKLPKIKADQQQIVSLFQNLISNAIKYSKPETKPEIIIKGRKEKGYVVLSVSDNGIGIKKDYQEKVFKIFHQLHAKTKYEGSGIGLAICKKIVERHDGEIWFESEVGKGTTFLMKFPTTK